MDQFQLNIMGQVLADPNSAPAMAQLEAFVVELGKCSCYTTRFTTQLFGKIAQSNLEQTPIVKDFMSHMACKEW